MWLHSSGEWIIILWWIHKSNITAVVLLLCIQHTNHTDLLPTRMRTHAPSTSPTSGPSLRIFTGFSLTHCSLQRARNVPAKRLACARNASATGPVSTSNSVSRGSMVRERARTGGGRSLNASRKSIGWTLGMNIWRRRRRLEG